MLLWTDVFATTKTSTGTGSWNTAGSWSPSGVPAAGDAVIIAAGHTITIDINTTSLLSLTVNGTLIVGSNNTDRSVTITGSVIINPAGVLNTAGNGGNSVLIGGDLTNNGVFDANIGGARLDLTFIGTTNQTIGGTGNTTDFNLITVNNTGATNNNIVEVSSNSFTVAGTSFLALTSGFFKVSGSFSLSNAFFTTAGYTINADEGFWLNNPNVMVDAQNASVFLSGLLRISAGTYNIGTNSGQSLQYSGNTSQIIIEGGTLTIPGRLSRDATSSSTTTYSQGGGTVSVGSLGSADITRAIFEIANAGSSFTMSGGTIIVHRSSSFTSDFLNQAGTSSVTGGTIQIGGSGTPGSQVIRIFSTVPVFNLTLNASNGPTARLVSGDLIVKNNVSIAFGTILNANNLNLLVAHNWTNNGAFTPGTGTVTFNGSTSQTINGSNSTTFSNLTINNSDATGVTFNTAQTVTSVLTLTDGYLNTFDNTSLLTLNDNATVTGASDASFVTGPVRKIGNDAFTFPVGKSEGGFYQPVSISALANTTDDFTAEYVRSTASGLNFAVADPIKNVSNCDYWNLLKNSVAPVNLSVTLSWNANSSCNASPYITNPSTLTIAHYNGTAWEQLGSTTGSFAGTITSGTVTRDDVDIIAPTFYALANTDDGDNPLPVKFGSLKGYAKNSGVQLDWETYTEENVSHYEVQRSANGNQYSNIALVFATNSPGRSKYNLFDGSPLPGINFYRIKSIDNDGRTSYSAIIRVELGKKDGDITIYPNPVKGGQFSFQSGDLPKGDYVIKIYDNNGKQLHSEGLKHSGGAIAQTITLPAAVKAGVYLVQMDNENTRVMNQLFVVQ